MKKILLAANTSWYLYNFRQSTIRALKQRGYEVVCVAPQDNYSVKLRELGVIFVPVKMNNQGLNPIQELLVFFRLARILKSTNPIYVFNFTIKMNLYIGIASRMTRIPYANNISGLGTAFLRGSLLQLLAKTAYAISNKGAKQVFFQNADDKEYFIHSRLVDESRAVLIPGSGIDLAKFDFCELPGSHEKFTFLMIARIIADKGVREFVYAASMLKERYPDTRWILMGPNDVDNRSTIHDDEIENWRSDNIVEFVGEQPDVIPWLRKCHVVVLPSYREGMPRAVLEAAAIGRPAIVSNVPGCRHAIVPDRTGWLCEAQNTKDLADVMEKVRTLPLNLVQEAGRKASLHATQHFSEKL